MLTYVSPKGNGVRTRTNIVRGNLDQGAKEKNNGMDIWQIVALFFIITSILPAIQKRMLEWARLRQMQAMEGKRHSRVIVLIHRQETMSLLGFPVLRYIDIEDSEEVLRAIKLTDGSVPIDVILHTPGGLVLAAEQIAHALNRHPAKVTVFVPHYAMSGGTLIALSADEIVMDENAVLGPVDPQLGELPAASILTAVSQKDINEVDDRTLIMADIAVKAIRQVRERVRSILSDNIASELAEALADTLSGGTWTHDYPITAEEAKGLGLLISTDVPEEVYRLMSLYRQPRQKRPSVSYVPVPYPGQGQEPAPK